jgi:hypothetical protein
MPGQADTLLRAKAKGLDATTTPMILRIMVQTKFSCHPGETEMLRFS